MAPTRLPWPPGHLQPREADPEGGDGEISPYPEKNPLAAGQDAVPHMYVGCSSHAPPLPFPWTPASSLPAPLTASCSLAALHTGSYKSSSLPTSGRSTLTRVSGQAAAGATRPRVGVGGCHRSDARPLFPRSCSQQSSTRRVARRAVQVSDSPWRGDDAGVRDVGVSPGLSQGMGDASMSREMWGVPRNGGCWGKPGLSRGGEKPHLSGLVVTWERIGGCVVCV